MDLTIPKTSGEPLTISVEVGEQLYVVGANGTGKSALFQHWVSSMGVSAVKRIAAHRQTWLPSGNLDFTAQSRKQFEQNSMHWDSQQDARWKEESPAERQSALLFDLVAKDNARSRAIGQYIDDKNPKQATIFAAKSISLSSNSMTCSTWEHSRFRSRTLMTKRFWRSVRIMIRVTAWLKCQTAREPPQ